jgi:hypothetical protein
MAGFEPTNPRTLILPDRRDTDEKNVLHPGKTN